MYIYTSLVTQVGFFCYWCRKILGIESIEQLTKCKCYKKRRSNLNTVNSETTKQIGLNIIIHLQQLVLHFSFQTHSAFSLIIADVHKSMHWNISTYIQCKAIIILFSLGFFSQTFILPVSGIKLNVSEVHNLLKLKYLRWSCDFFIINTILLIIIQIHHWSSHTSVHCRKQD